MAQTTFLDDRLLKAALAVIQHGELVEVRYVGFGNWRDCILLGRGVEPKTVKLGIWCAGGEIREGRKRDGSPMPIRFIDVLIPPATLKRLEEIAAEQGSPTTEKARAEQFIEFAKATAAQQGRNRISGRYRDGLHDAEPAGRR